MVANLYSKKPLYQYARDLILASREAIYARGHFPREPDEVTDVRSQLMNLSISIERWSAKRTKELEARAEMPDNFI